MEHSQNGQDIFERFLACEGPDQDAEDLLAVLLTMHAWPLMAQVVRRRLGNFYNPGDAAELTNDAILQLLARLRRMRAERTPGVEIRIGAYSAGIAANTVLQHIGRRCPESNRLRKQLRYLFETDARLRIWALPDGVAVCGLAKHEGKPDVCGADALEWCAARLRQRPTPRLAQLTHEILLELPGPIELSKLVRLVGPLLGLQEPAYLSPDPKAGDAGAIPDPAASVALRFELRDRLDGLWREVGLLPAPQRAALLLNLRSTEGAALWLFTDLGIASLRELAAALEMTREELAAIWNDLPLEDRVIATRLGLERQQVVNLRSAARRRLAIREKMETKETARI